LFAAKSGLSMEANGILTETAVWSLAGPLGGAEPMRYVPISATPFVVGRRPDLALSLSCNAVSSLHAEFVECDGSLVLRDLGSTNGTYVNGQRIAERVILHDDDLVQFASMLFRVRRQTNVCSTNTVHEDFCDQALALIQFDKLMSEEAVTPFFQPIVSIATKGIVGYEILARSRLFGLRMPEVMFNAAARLEMEKELSVMLRAKGVLASERLPGPPHVFMNMHPREMTEGGLLDSLRQLRHAHPRQPMTLEIHEAVVTDAARMSELRRGLNELRISLAYDDFGAGQSRLNEMAQYPPDYLKFDISLVHEIESAPPRRQQLVASLVQMAHDLGIVALAEGIETAAESDACEQIGFDLGQGFFYGRPASNRCSPSILD
jgi:EAL domain-containing protein (putative c-di-GMP-specific phosphodiesterase class I)